MKNSLLSWFRDNQFVPLALILGVALVFAALVGSWTVLAVRGMNNTLTVTGSARTPVVADSVRFTFSINRTVTVDALESGYTQIDADLAAVRTFMKNNGIKDEEVQVDPVMTNQFWDSNSAGPTKYTVSRQITINSPRVKDITAFAQNLSKLSSKGVLVQANPLQYYYSKLADLRVSLLGDALKDAKARANAIAKESGRSIGRLQSANSGVVQVLAPNSIDVTDSGQYDTSTIDKVVMVTVRATFFVR